MKQEFIVDKGLDHIERSIIFNKVIEMILNMIPFSFERQLLTSQETFKNEMFFKT